MRPKTLNDDFYLNLILVHRTVLLWDWGLLFILGSNHVKCYFVKRSSTYGDAVTSVIGMIMGICLL